MTPREILIDDVRKRAAELRRQAHIIAIAPLDMFNDEDLTHLVQDLDMFTSTSDEQFSVDRVPEKPEPLGSPTNNVGGWARSITFELDDFNDWDVQYDFSKVTH